MLNIYLSLIQVWKFLIKVYKSHLINSCAEFIFGNMNMRHFTPLRWCRYLKPILEEDNDTFMLHIRYHCYWWHVDYIIRASAARVLTYFSSEYSGFCNRRINSGLFLSRCWWGEYFEAEDRRAAWRVRKQKGGNRPYYLEFSSQFIKLYLCSAWQRFRWYSLVMQQNIFACHLFITNLFPKLTLT